ncbi:MAG: alpha/beta hydrolase [Ectothiorhodospiraceae bacterium]|nr:alpha/beta hydrolase [Ectothiorhodospiraceae bacterium]
MSTVYRDYDQAALDAQYEQRTLVPDISEYEREWVTGSEAARRWPHIRPDLAYGPGARERVDLYLPSGAGPHPLVVFYHGGAWTRFEKASWSFPAPVFVERGIAFAVAGFHLTPEVRLEVQAEQAASALAWLHRHAAELALDPTRVFAAGHSSGAHLAAMVTTAARGTEPLPTRGALLVSGIYDLEPVQRSARNGYLHLTPEQARALSPIARIPPRPAPVIVAWGGGELAEFQRQSRTFADAWAEAGGAVTRVPCPEHNHFAITRELARPTGPALAAFLDLIETTAR